MSVEKAIEHLGDQLGQPVQFRWVCENNHVGAPGRKKQSGEERISPCFECGAPATLKPVSPSGKKRRPHSLKRFEEKDEADREGPIVMLEPLPDDFELSARHVRELNDGAHPTITLPKDGMVSLKHGHLYSATDEIDIYVLAVRDERAVAIVDYVVHRSEQLVREDAPLIDRSATRQGRLVNLATGEELPPSPEAERLGREELNAMTREVHERKLAETKQLRERQESLLRELEKTFTKHECWPARQQVNRILNAEQAIEERIRELQKPVRGKAA